MIADPQTAPETPAAHPGSGSRLRAGVRRALSPRNASALYVFIVILAIFSLWVPDTFLAETTWRTLLDSQAITALVAIALVVPLAAGAFNLAVGAEVGFGAILVAWLLSTASLPIVPAIALTLVAGALIGVISGLLIIRANIDSFIATLGMSSILIAGIAWVSSGEQILGLSSGFQSIATTQILGITLPVYLMVVVAAVVWYGLERTPAGRRVYATGGNIEAARLAGVRTGTVIVVSLAVCGVLAAAAGTLVTSRIATGDPTVGPSFLLPAFSAAFLGSTQFRGGRFNVWGTVVAVYVLATGVKGLQLAGAPVWIPDLFNGAALLIAVGMAKYHRTAARASAVDRLIGGRLRRYAGRT
jgi:ribose transport system permease protein